MSDSTCRSTRELLPWYLNRTLAEAERAEVERHLETCADCRAELDQVRWSYRMYAQHLPSVAVLAYVAAEGPRLDLGGGATLDRATAEEHLAACAACREEVAMARESLEALDDEPIAEPAAPSRGRVVPFAPRRRTEGTVSPWGRRFAVAASLLMAVVAASGWWNAAQQADEHAATVAELERRLESTAAAPAEPGAAGSQEALAAAQRTLETMQADLEATEARLEEGQRELGELRAEVRRPRLTDGVLLTTMVLRGEDAPAPQTVPKVVLEPDGATITFTADGVMGRQRARIIGAGQRMDLEVVVERVEEGTPVLSLSLPPGSLEPGRYELELLDEGLSYPFRVLAAD